VLDVQFNTYHEIALIAAFEAFQKFCPTKFACNYYPRSSFSLYRRGHSREINFTLLLRDTLETGESHGFASDKDNVSRRLFLSNSFKNSPYIFVKKDI